MAGAKPRPLARMYRAATTAEHTQQCTFTMSTLSFLSILPRVDRWLSESEAHYVSGYCSQELLLTYCC